MGIEVADAAAPAADGDDAGEGAGVTAEVVAADAVTEGDNEATAAEDAAAAFGAVVAPA